MDTMRQPRKPPPPTRVEGDQSTRRRSFWGRVIDDPIAAFTAVLAVFTVVLTLIGGLQTWAFIESERAFLTVGNLSVTLLPDTPVTMLFLIRNTGKSVASIKEMNVSFAKTLPSTPNYSVPLSGLFVGPILPGADNAQVYRPNQNAPLWKLTASEIDGIKNRRQDLFTFGYVRYSDEFGIFGDRITGFCYLLNPSSGGIAFETCNNPAYTYLR